LGDQATVPPGVRERFRGREEATKVVPAPEEAMKADPARATGRFEGAAMTAARYFASANCRATGAAMTAARRFASANCRATAGDQLGESRAGAPNREALRAARFAGAEADRNVAERHRIAYRCAKVIHRAADCRFHCRVRWRVRTSCGLCPWNAAAAS